jgi:hypothetical protein
MEWEPANFIAVGCSDWFGRCWFVHDEVIVHVSPIEQCDEPVVTNRPQSSVPLLGGIDVQPEPSLDKGVAQDAMVEHQRGPLVHHLDLLRGQPAEVAVSGRLTEALMARGLGSPLQVMPGGQGTHCGDRAGTFIAGHRFHVSKALCCRTLLLTCGDNRDEQQGNRNLIAVRCSRWFGSFGTPTAYDCQGE